MADTMQTVLTELVESYLRSAGLSDKDVESTLQSRKGIQRLGALLLMIDPTLEERIDEYDLEL